MLDVAALSVMLLAVLFFGGLLVAAWRYPAEQPMRSASARPEPAEAAAPARQREAAPASPERARPTVARPGREAAARRRTGAVAILVLGAGLGSAAAA